MIAAVRGGAPASPEIAHPLKKPHAALPLYEVMHPAEYLRELLLRMLHALHAGPTVARLVVVRLSLNPILDPLLAERLLLTLAALGVPAEALPKMFQGAMGVIFEMILTVSTRSGAAGPPHKRGADE